jgi:hypothetical protein
VGGMKNIFARLKEIFFQTNLLAEIVGPSGRREIVSHNQYVYQMIEESRLRASGFPPSRGPSDRCSVFVSAIKRKEML